MAKVKLVASDIDVATDEEWSQLFEKQTKPDKKTDAYDDIVERIIDGTIVKLAVSTDEVKTVRMTLKRRLHSKAGEGADLQSVYDDDNKILLVKLQAKDTVPSNGIASDNVAPTTPIGRAKPGPKTRTR